MPRSGHNSPLDNTIDRLERLTLQVRTELEDPDEIAREDYWSVKAFVSRCWGSSDFCKI